MNSNQNPNPQPTPVEPAKKLLATFEIAPGVKLTESQVSEIAGHLADALTVEFARGGLPLPLAAPRIEFLA
jgi:hypothetical protein